MVEIRSFIELFRTAFIINSIGRGINIYEKLVKEGKKKPVSVLCIWDEEIELVYKLIYLSRHRMCDKNMMAQLNHRRYFSETKQRR